MAQLEDSDRARIEEYRANAKEALESGAACKAEHKEGWAHMAKCYQDMADRLERKALEG